MSLQEGLLIIEDNRSSACLYQVWLTSLGESITLAHSGTEALAALDAGLRPQVVLLDMHLPDTTGMELLRIIRKREAAARIVVVTSDDSPELAVEAMKEGAHDYLLKPVDDHRLRVSVANALRAAQLESLAHVALHAGDDRPLEGFVGSSLPMQALYKTVRLAALSDAPVFISGESGTGKELCAQAIHYLSRRKDKPLISINCAAMPSDLVESQLFGHVKGAFTGAVQARRGLAEEAHGGTLFLDEVTELGLDVQSKLLRFLQTGEMTPVGTSISKQVDCRVVCATNLDVREAVAQGRFRQDLFYRLHVIPIMMPPLRDRGDDIVELAGMFVQRYSASENKAFRGFTDGALQALMQHDWPGNVRELQNVVRYAVIMHDGRLLDAGMLQLQPAAPAPMSWPEPEAAPADTRMPGHGQVVRPFWQVERDAILGALEVCEGNVTRAAVMLELAPSTLYRKLKSYSTELSSSQAGERTA